MSTKLHPSRSEYPVTELERRIDLAACYRLVAHYGMSDMIYTHITARVPGKAEQMLLNPYGLLFEEVTASNLIKVDLEGRKVEPSPYQINAAGFIIHASIYRSREDVGCVIHTHTTAGAAISALDCGLLPISQSAMEFFGRTAYHTFEGLATNQEEGARIAGDLKSCNVMIMRNHGLLVVGPSVPAAFETAYYLEQACRIQLAAQNSGSELHIPAAEVCEHTARQYETPGVIPKGHRLWSAMIRMLDRSGTTYRS